MISISITSEAYKAIKATLPETPDDAASRLDERGHIRIWLTREFVVRDFATGMSDKKEGLAARFEPTIDPSSDKPAASSFGP